MNLGVGCTFGTLHQTTPMSYVTYSYKNCNVYLRVPPEHLYGGWEDKMKLSKHMEDIRSIETFKMEVMLFKALFMLPIDIKCYQILKQNTPKWPGNILLKVLIRINCRSIEI